ncbi:MAG TPA: LacI family DNA-binding transcriptional regulator [Dermatophilaceae bacterium]|nr:LacI family DNA-binding transcriptional regulator [Dermatophilaceae bacterium]
MKAVAEAAGVSLSTASLVFSGRGPVADTTAARVRAAARDLGYAGPDPVASSLRHGRTGTVAVVVEGRLLHAFRDPFAVALLDGLAQELDEAATAMLLVAQRPEDPASAVGRLALNAVDAVAFALCGPRDNPVVAHLAGRGIPMVGAGAPVDPRVVQLLVDDRGASAGAARHLAALGHRRVAHVAMPLSPGAVTGRAGPAEVAHAAYPDSRDRALGFADVFGARAPLAQAALPDVAEGAAAARLLLDVPADERPTAVVAQSDLLAVGVVRAAGALGLRVPADLSVTGFDGVELPWFDAVLTTVVQPAEAKGRRLGAMVLALARGEQVADAELPLSLRVGTTSGPPPGSAAPPRPGRSG